MATSNFRLSNSRISASRLGVDVNNGSLGSMITINATANFSLVPPTTFSRYYYIYVVNTNATINITLPGTANIARGWRARIILISSANTGFINLIDAVGTFIGSISSALAQSGVEIVFTDIANQRFRIIYYYGNTNTAAQRMITYDTSNNAIVPFVKPLSAMQFFSYSDNTVGTLNANIAGAVIIPWVGTTGRYVDTNYFNTATASNITPTEPNFIIKISACVYVNATGGATAVTIARLSLNGTTTVIPQQVTSGTIANTSTQVLNIIGYFISTTPNFVNLQVGKAATSVGTNIIDRVNTYILAEYITT